MTAPMNPGDAARLLASLRKTRGGGKGRPLRPTYCRLCGVKCPSAAAAKAHPKTEECCPQGKANA